MDKWWQKAGLTAVGALALLLGLSYFGFPVYGVLAQGVQYILEPLLTVLFFAAVITLMLVVAHLKTEPIRMQTRVQNEEMMHQLERFNRDTIRLRQESEVWEQQAREEMETFLKAHTEQWAKTWENVERMGKKTEMSNAFRQEIWGLLEEFIKDHKEMVSYLNGFHVDDYYGPKTEIHCPISGKVIKFPVRIYDDAGEVYDVTSILALPQDEAGKRKHPVLTGDKEWFSIKDIRPAADIKEKIYGSAEQDVSVSDRSRPISPAP